MGDGRYGCWNDELEEADMMGGEGGREGGREGERTGVVEVGLTPCHGQVEEAEEEAEGRAILKEGGGEGGKKGGREGGWSRNADW